MHRNFGIMSDRQAPRGASVPPAATHGSYAPGDNIIVFPSGSILAEPVSSPLERSKFAQSLLDILALGSGAVLVCSLASAIGIFGYVLKLKFFS